MRSFKVLIRELRGFLILWLTQSFSALGSAMTNFALIVWSYQAQGSALTTALLSVCSYAPYVVMSIFAGALSDRWNKKAVMLASDSFAALCTVAVLVLLQAGQLEIWHLYCLNALNGLMNTVQQPAADVAISLLTPERHYQKASGLRSLANSLINMLTPMFATALLALAGIHAVILFDLFTFFAAFLSLLFLVKLPAAPSGAARAESVLRCARQGLRFLKGQRGILHLILFLAAINFTASVYNAAFPAMLLSRQGGGEAALGAVNTATGAALLLGSAAASALPPRWSWRSSNGERSALARRDRRGGRLDGGIRYGQPCTARHLSACHQRTGLRRLRLGQGAEQGAGRAPRAGKDALSARHPRRQRGSHSRDARLAPQDAPLVLQIRPAGDPARAARAGLVSRRPALKQRRTFP